MERSGIRGKAADTSQSPRGASESPLRFLFIHWPERNFASGSIDSGFSRLNLRSLSRKQNAHRRGYRKTLSLRGQLARLRISRKNADLVRVLIGHQHPPLGRTEHKVAWRFASAVK